MGQYFSKGLIGRVSKTDLEMRKKELIHMNRLCTMVGQEIVEGHDVEHEQVLGAYDNAPVDGPHDVLAPKSDQKDVLFDLITDITQVIEEEIEAAEPEEEKSTLIA